MIVTQFSSDFIFSISSNARSNWSYYWWEYVNCKYL